MASPAVTIMNKSNAKPLKIAIIDYQLSNLFSVQHACEYVGAPAFITSSSSEILSADAAILPGVGAFADAMNNLEKLSLITTIHDFIRTGKPFMGICLGLQLLFTESEEFGNHKGLNIIPGKVVKFPTLGNDNRLLKVPQIGWNKIIQPHSNNQRWQNTPLSNLANGEYMYFVHSYYTIPKNENDILTETTYEDTTYASSVSNNNITAYQFHPEKSGVEGIKIYQNWINSINN